MSPAQRRLVVLEANEVPLRIIAEFARREPGSAIARLLRDGRALETEVREETGRELYPSQTWYSMNSGVPFHEHHVFWYGDPKPVEHPLYWQVAARAGRRVGVVNTLHSSPLARQCADGNFAFVIPDCFADDAATLPVRYERFQELNLALTHQSGRRASMRLSPTQLRAVASLPVLGVRPTTIAQLTRLVAEIATKRRNKERLRAAQALLLSDMFVSLCRKNDPDLAVLFTNHVASAMHRYWFALFPDDWGAPLYDQAWVDRYSDEVLAAMRVLDRMVADIEAWTSSTGRTLVVLASMGQSAAGSVDTSRSSTLVVRDASRFARAIGIVAEFDVGSAMVPQIHYEFASTSEAEDACATISRTEVEGGNLEAEQNDRVITVTYRLGAGVDDHVMVDGAPISLETLGATRESIDDHRSGDHDPRGAMLVSGSALADDLPDVIDALDVAPMLLELLGVDAVPGMRTASHTL